MIFTADIEDWQQSVLDFDNPVSPRVVANTQRLLDILANHQVTGTFFIQGMVAERFPVLVNEIAQAGHEIASHAWSHRHLYSLTPQQVKDEVKNSVTALEQAASQKVYGFRAPSFSVRQEMLDWYCEALLEQGLRYDSSIVVVKSTIAISGHYGFEGDDAVKQIQARGLDCYPMTVGEAFGKRMPVMGGGYFRVYPYWLTRYLARNIDRANSVFYMHPYELDTQEYHALSTEHQIPWKTALHQFSRRSTVAKKLSKLLKDYEFQSFADCYYAETLSLPDQKAA